MTLSDLTSKTPEELNVMCAELCGWKRWQDHDDFNKWVWTPPNLHDMLHARANPPNYTGSWDAIMPEVRKLKYYQKESFVSHLIQVTMNSPHSTYCCCATASPKELTQALILTLTKWN